MPAYFLLHMLTLPILRMFPTPAHDGVRLFLPTFFFLSAFAGWGVDGMGDLLARGLRMSRRLVMPVLALLAIGPAAWQLARIHPFELSYYNELIGGPRGAWKKGFELAYWYDAFNEKTIEEVNRVLPKDASVAFSSILSTPPTFLELQTLGALRGDLVVGYREGDPPPFMWLLTQDSKATALSRLLFVMRPFYERRPKQLEGLRVFAVTNPAAYARASCSKCCSIMKLPNDRNLGFPFPNRSSRPFPSWLDSGARG